MKKAFLTMTLIAVLFFCSESIYATGVGFYGDFSSGLTFGKYRNSHWAPGGGLIIDTNIAQNDIFNYRFEFGYDWFNVSWFPGSSANYYFDSCSKISTNHYFGFGLIRNQHIRFWVGPQIEVSGLFSQGHNGIFGGLGFAMGTNFHISDVFSFSMVISLRAVGGMIYGNYQRTTSPSALSGILGMFGFASNNVETVNENLGFYGGNGRISLACIFRISDVYAAPPVTSIKLITPAAPAKPTAPPPPPALVAPVKPAVPAFQVPPVKK